MLSTLLENRLVRLAGRKEVVGKPFLYRTTKEFLAHFGLDSLKELPPLEEFEEMLGLELSAELGAAPEDDVLETDGELETDAELETEEAALAASEEE